MGHALPRRIAAALAGAALSTAMLAACGGDDEASPPTHEPVPEEALATALSENSYTLSEYKKIS